MRHFNHEPKFAFTYDLHVLSIPPTFVLSQDQTLQLYNCIVLILFVSLFGLFSHKPLTYFCYLVFKDPVLLRLSPLRQERENIEKMLLCQPFIFCFVSFFLLRLTGPHFVMGALQTKGVYTELNRMSQAPF